MRFRQRIAAPVMRKTQNIAPAKGVCMYINFFCLRFQSLFCRQKLRLEFG